MQTDGGPGRGNGVVFGALVGVGLVGSGALEILAGAGVWNPLGLRGRAIAGALRVASSLALLALTSLPPRIRGRLPDWVVLPGVAAIVASFLLDR